MSLCKSIDTLSMAYLDDELATEERHELEAHLTECVDCRGHVDEERADRQLVHRALAAPPAPDLLRARLVRALDAEDEAATRAGRRRWTQWLLPGSAVLAAAAAIAVFVGVQPSDGQVGDVAHEAARVQTRSLPMEVEGARTVAWLRQHFQPDLEPPRVAEPGTELVGARLWPVKGHDGALLSYRVNLTGHPFTLSVLVVRDVGPDELSGGDEVRIGNRTLHVVQDSGKTLVTYVDGHMGYMFSAPALSANELVWLVGRTNLVGLPR